jgi:RND family efflux transporter MFP subunit
MLGLVVPSMADPTGDGRNATAGSTPAEHEWELVGLTGPYREAILAAVLPARIDALPVDEGARIRTGEVAVRLHDAVQVVKTEIAAAAAESTLAVDLARARWQRDQRNLERLTGLHGNDYASSKELSDAYAAAEIARLDYEIARFQHAQFERAHEREKHLLGEYRLRAPFDGYVTRHLKMVGETADQLEGIVKLVQVDPLRVTVDCPLALAQRIKVGDTALVRADPSDAPPRIGTVVLVSPVADGASQTFRVGLTVDNADGAWLAGAKATVVMSARPVTADATTTGAYRAARP